MANEYRNQRTRRTTGDDWREDAGYSDWRNRQRYGDYGNYRDSYGNDQRFNTQGGYSERGSDHDYGRADNWQRRNFDTEGYDDVQGSRAYSRSSYQPQYRNTGDYDRGAYSSDYGYQGRYHRGVGFNSPQYGREHMHRDDEFYNRGRRDFWDRATDEMASWFGDHDAERRRHMDKMESHRGKGPKGYRRSDERIREDINDRLSDDPWIDASDIEVTVNNSAVTLTGNVRDRQDKRRVEDIADRVSGVSNVENRVRVAQDTADYKYPTATTTAGATNTDSKAENGKSKQSSRTM